MIDLSTSSSDPTRCTLCGQSVSATPITNEGDNYDTFCSSGCQDVHQTLITDPKAVNHSNSNSDETFQTDSPQPDEQTGTTSDPNRVFLHIDGLHSTTDEAFIESVAKNHPGVIEAEASYVTESIRIEYNADQCSQDELKTRLTTLGYSATLRDDESDDALLTGHTRVTERGLNEMLGLRYIAGILFASFMMLPYVVLFYPGHLADLVGGELSAFFGGAAGIGSGAGVLVLPLFLALTGVVLFFTGAPLLRGAYISSKMRQPTTELLVSLAVISAFLLSTIVVLRGGTGIYYDLTVVIAASVVAAMFYESVTKQRAMDRLTELTISQVNEARILAGDDSTRTIDVDNLEPGDRILVRQGERIPIDGVLEGEECTVDEAVVTGESVPVLKQPGDDVIGGSVVTADAAVVRVDQAASNSVDQLMTTVWELQTATHGGQRRANQLASYAIPIILGAAVISAGSYLVTGRGVIEAITVLLTVPIVATPWALGLASPLSVATSIEEALKRGIVVFDETIFERLRAVETVVFDKTGTLTSGEMTVIEAEAPTELLQTAAVLERRATHPAANAIVEAFEDIEADPNTDETNGDDSSETALKQERVQEFTTYATGVQGIVGEKTVLVGNEECFNKQGWTIPKAIADQVSAARDDGHLPVIVGRDGTAEGIITVGDQPRKEWETALTQLNERDIDIIVLTGDNSHAAQQFDQHPAVNHVFAGVPPTGKLATITHLQEDGSVTMVGDGTNDGPALARADLGIALGSGTAIASDAANIAIMKDDLTAIETAFELADAAQTRMRQNNGLALVYNAITIPLAAIGALNPLLAMGAVVVSGGSIGINSVRTLLAD